MKNSILFLLIFIASLYSSAQNEADMDITYYLSDNIAYYGISEQKDLPPQSLENIKFRYYKLFWQDSKDGTRFPALATESNKHYLKHIYNEEGYLFNLQLAFLGLPLKNQQIEFSKEPNVTEKTSMSALLKDLLPGMLEKNLSEYKSIYLTMVSKPDLLTTGLYDKNGFKMSSYFIYIIWSNDGKTKLPEAFKGSTHILLFGEEQPLKFNETEALGEETKTPQPVGHDSLVARKPEPPIIEQPEESPPEKPSYAGMNETATRNFFQNNFPDNWSYGTWQTDKDNNLIYKNCTVPLSDNQLLFSNSELQFDLLLKNNENLPEIKMPLPEQIIQTGSFNAPQAGEKHINQEFIENELKNFLHSEIGISVNTLKATVSEDEKTVTLNLVEGKINGIDCVVEPTSLNIKYTDFNLLFDLDPDAVYRDNPIEPVEILDNLQILSNDSRELPVSETTVRIPYLLYGAPDLIRAALKSNEKGIYLTGIVFKQNNLQIIYSLDKNIAVLVIYPHFFNNKRPLARELEKIIEDINSKNGQYFIYISSEFNPVIYNSETPLRTIKNTVSQMYGNLVPNTNLDFREIQGSPDYKNLIEEKNLVSASYHYFAPAQFWTEFKQEFFREESVNGKHNIGIITENLLNSLLPYTEVMLYFPKGSQHISSLDIGSLKCKIIEI